MRVFIAYDRFREFVVSFSARVSMLMTKWSAAFHGGFNRKGQGEAEHVDVDGDAILVLRAYDLDCARVCRAIHGQ